jgi:hypothetical protein
MLREAALLQLRSSQGPVSNATSWMVIAMLKSNEL